MNKCVATMTTALVGLLAFVSADAGPYVADTGDRVVLVTIDGARTQEIFGGLDASVLKSTLKDGQAVETITSFQTITERARTRAAASSGSPSTCIAATASRAGSALKNSCHAESSGIDTRVVAADGAPAQSVHRVPSCVNVHCPPAAPVTSRSTL